MWVISKTNLYYTIISNAFFLARQVSCGYLFLFGKTPQGDRIHSVAKPTLFVINWPCFVSLCAYVALTLYLRYAYVVLLLIPTMAHTMVHPMALPMVHTIDIYVAPIKLTFLLTGKASKLWLKLHQLKFQLTISKASKFWLKLLTHILFPSTYIAKLTINS